MQVQVIGFWGAYPKAQQAASCYLISDENTNILLDMGSGSLATLQKYFDITKLDAVIISHFHGDHFSDIFCLQHAILINQQLGKRENPLKIYAPNDENFFEKLNFRESTSAHLINENSEIRIGSLKLTFAKTEHPIYGLSVRVTNGTKSIVYTADTELNDNLITLASNCDVLLSECSIYRQYEGVITGHMSGRDLGALAKNSNAGMVIVTHLPVYGDNKELLEDVIKIYKGRVVLASEGLEITL